jgi:hypothetical protein
VCLSKMTLLIVFRKLHRFIFEMAVAKLHKAGLKCISLSNKFPIPGMIVKRVLYFKALKI